MSSVIPIVRLTENCTFTEERDLRISLQESVSPGTSAVSGGCSRSGVDGLGGRSSTQARRRHPCWKDLQSLDQDWSGKVEKCATADSATGIPDLTVMAKCLISSKRDAVARTCPRHRCVVPQVPVRPGDRLPSQPSQFQSSPHRQ
jgi:hypothetical protein